VPGKAVGQAAVELPWFCPNTDSLVALANAPASVPSVSVADPALAVFILRFAQPAREPDTFGLAPGALYSPILPETAAAYLSATDSGVLPDSSFILGRVHSVARRAAEIASALADATRLVPAHAAATAVRLAPLGWYAIAAVDPFDAADPLADPRFPTQPAEVERELWGKDHAAITRRLVERWHLPRWIATTISNLALPLRVVQGLVVDRALFAIAQLSVMEAESESISLGLTHSAHRGELLDYLRLDAQALGCMRSTAVENSRIAESGLDPNPHHVTLVGNLLRLAGESRRRNGPGLVARLEDHIDALHQMIAQMGQQVGERLRDAKLTGLAELAAGAGHEINNPLAIISGNAQRLLRREPDVDRCESLQAIIRQANRIAGLLRDLMHFARPPKPEPRILPLSELMQRVFDDLAPFAIEREVQMKWEPIQGDIWLNGDPKHLQHAVGAVLRNAIEAAPREGWVRVSCIASEDVAPVIAVEDNGPGLTPEAAEHAFDPFYCGRMAGRGRGLGLPTAWQLLRQNGGNLSLDQTAEGPTRFLIKMRRAAAYDLLSLRSA